MPAAARSQYSKSFKQGLASLTDEIRLALQWQRPSILVAVHKGTAGQQKARAQLTREIEALGLQVHNIEPDRVHPNPIASIHALSADGVYFLSGIGRNSDDVRADIYRALNFQRERIVEQRIVLVLWMDVQEAADLARFAPDFWSFRHRVVEFAPDRGPAKK